MLIVNSELKKLRNLQDPEVNKIIIDSLGDPDIRVKIKAVDLLGAMGVAVTPLRPSGKAQFGGQFLDVIAEGDYVAPGGRVQVIEIEGTRIVVKEV